MDPSSGSGNIFATSTGGTDMKTKSLVGALLAAGVIATGAAAYRGHLDAPLAQAHAATAAIAAGVAAPAANPGATSLPLNGFTDLVKRNGPAVVNVSVEGTRKASAGREEMPEELREFFRGFGGRVPGMPRGDMPMRGMG